MGLPRVRIISLICVVVAHTHKLNPMRPRQDHEVLQDIYLCSIFDLVGVEVERKDVEGGNTCFFVGGEREECGVAGEAES